MAVVKVNGLFGGGGGGGSFSVADAVYNAADFTANGTWTVAAFSSTNYVKFGQFSNNSHLVICYVYITGDYVGAGSGFLNIVTPFTWVSQVRVAAQAWIAGISEPCGIFLPVAGSNTSIRFERFAGLGWPASTILVAGQVTGFI